MFDYLKPDLMTGIEPDMKNIFSNILREFRSKDIFEFGDKLHKICVDNDLEGFAKYATLAPSLDQDWLRKFWEFYGADRVELKQDYTPPSLGLLVAHVMGPEKGLNIYDCCAGTGSLTIQRWLLDEEAKFLCREKDPRVLPFLLFNLAVRNIAGYVAEGDALTGRDEKIYKLEKGDGYSTVTVVDKIEMDVDFCVSNPPFNLKYKPAKPIGGLFADPKNRGVPTPNTANFAFVDEALKIARRAAFILPDITVNENNDREYKKWLVKKDMVMAVIKMTPNMFANTCIPVVVWVFGTNESRGIAFIDASKASSKTIRMQAGEDHTEKSVYEKQITELTTLDILKIFHLIYSRNSDALALLSRYSPAAVPTDYPFAVVSQETIEAKNWALNPSLYTPLETGAGEHRPIKQIMSDIRDVVIQRNSIKITINDTWAKQLELNTLYEHMKNSNKCVETMEKQNIYKDFGVEFIKNDYISLSQNKTFSIENADKNTISFMLRQILPVYTFNIFECNNRESKYLAELREAVSAELFKESS
jgi:hypothetical protein